MDHPNHPVFEFPGDVGGVFRWFFSNSNVWDSYNKNSHQSGKTKQQVQKSFFLWSRGFNIYTFFCEYRDDTRNGSNDWNSTPIYKLWWNKSFINVDEAQNATIHQLKTIITRVGQGSKIVLLGDVDQIDTPYIDRRSNGLSIVIDKFKSSRLAAHINLSKGQRSDLASAASNILQGIKLWLLVNFKRETRKG